MSMRVYLNVLGKRVLFLIQPAKPMQFGLPLPDSLTSYHDQHTKVFSSKNTSGFFRKFYFSLRCSSSLFH